MHKDKTLHFVHFLLLGAISVAVIIVYYYFRGFPEKQFFIIEILGLLYFIWGNIYHYLKGDFHIKIVVEYLLIAITGILLLRGAIFR